MNPNESELEDRLRALSPVAPPPALAESIARELKPRETALAVRVPTASVLVRPAKQGLTFPGFLRGLGWACAGACVAVAAIFIAERSGEKPQPAPIAVAEAAPAFDLAESSAEILTAEDEGLVYSDDEALARRIRYSSIERHVWTDASTGAWMEIEIPREDVRLMPVAMQ
jgi:hypothetical protein